MKLRKNDKIDLIDPKKIVPLIFAVDDNYAPFLGVSLESLFAHASKERFYKIYVLNTGLSEVNRKRLDSYNSRIAEINYVCVAKQLDSISDKLYLRDYYTKTTYFRFFIPELFPQYDKVLYLDSDIILLDDVAKLFDIDLGNNFIGAVPEEVMSTVKVFGDYVEEGLGIPCGEYFNAGVALLNLAELRKFGLADRFVELLNKYKFEVTQDQDYLNVLCHGKVRLIDLCWNKTPFREVVFEEKKLKLIHYKLSFKPWLYEDILYGGYFWNYAQKSAFYNDILKIKESYTEENKEKDNLAYLNLMRLAFDYTNDRNNYKKLTESLV